MEYKQLESLLSDSTTVKLLRAQNAPLILSFLNREFKENNRISIPNHELVPKLSDFMEEVGFRIEEYERAVDDQESLDNLAIAKKYLDNWSDQNFIRKYPNDNGEHIHELTSDTEKGLQWMDGLEKRKFVGTESRFKDIFKKLKDLIDNTQDDPVEKIQELERKKAALEDEIRQIKITQHVQTYNETQVKERFYEVSKVARELLGDFKEVEQNFKEIIRTIYEKQADRNFHKGQIVGYALDAVEELKKKDQGRSFYNFWQFLVADKSQEELRSLVENVYALMDEMGIEYDDDRFLRTIKNQLYHAGKKVIDSNRQLSARLSKVLSEREMSERRKVMELIGDIRTAALRVVAKPPKDDKFIIIDDYPDVQMVMSRPLAEPTQEAIIINHPGDVEVTDLTSMNLDSLFSSFTIDREQLHTNINSFLKEFKQVSLAEIVQKHPIEKGLGEILTYLAIASQSAKHLISNENHVLLPLDKSELRFAKVPQVIYTK